MVDYPLIHEWFRKADSDYDTARHMLLEYYPMQIEIICFHCQQAVEKWLKGYLIYSVVDEPPKIHELNRLCDMCHGYSAKFSNEHEVIIGIPRQQIGLVNQLFDFTGVGQLISPLACAEQNFALWLVVCDDVNIGWLPGAVICPPPGTESRRDKRQITFLVFADNGNLIESRLL
jgi:hypothetical protein